MTARDESRGRKALEELRKDPLLKRDKALSSDGGLADVEYHALDISDEGSIRAFRDFLKEKHPDGVDIGSFSLSLSLSLSLSRLESQLLKIEKSSRQ